MGGPEGNILNWGHPVNIEVTVEFCILTTLPVQMAFFANLTPYLSRSILNNGMNKKLYLWTTLWPVERERSLSLLIDSRRAAAEDIT